MSHNEERAKKAEDEKTAGIAGAGAGVLAGAQVGTVILPIPVVGTFTGALVGGMIGSKIGKKVGGTLMEKWNSCTNDKSYAQQSELTRELERLAKLKEQGVLSEDEFKAAKAKLLGF